MKILSTEQNALATVAEAANQGFSNLLELLFGPAVRNKVFGPVTWADLGVAGCVIAIALIVDALLAWFFRRKHVKVENSVSIAETPKARDWRHRLLGAIAKPLHLLIWIFGIYVALSPLLLKLPDTGGAQALLHVINKFVDLCLFVAFFWLFFDLTRVVDAVLEAWAIKEGSKLEVLLAPLVGQSLRVIVPVVGIIFALPILGLPPEYASVVGKGSSILIICTVAWILTQIVHLGERAVLTRYDIKAADNLQARKLYTQVHVISKSVYFLIALFTMASILMLFEEARRFGTSILASAGVVGVVIGFAAQHTIANLFAGFQLALTQPIRLDDVVIVENEWGRVEEITLTYVVIHIWDDRRMVVPLSYFIEKPFQNWTRASADLLGSVMVWSDYSLPVDEVREAVGKIVAASPLWDKRFWNLQVSDASEHTMQLRVLATAADSSKAWDLRCEIREKLIDYIRRHHPEGLPKTRLAVERKKPDSQMAPV